MFRVLGSSQIKHCSRSFSGVNDDTYAVCLSVYLNRHPSRGHHGASTDLVLAQFSSTTLETTTQQ